MIKPKILSDGEIAQVLSNTLGTKLKFESKLTDQDITALKDELKIELHAIAQAQNDYCYKEMLGQFKDILNQMALEQCDPEVMPYFTDYYWLPKDIWRVIQSQLEEG